MSANKQLSEFYAKQGLTGKHLRKALKHDRKQVRLLKAQDYECLSGMFNWQSSPQGHGYWSARCGW